MLALLFLSAANTIQAWMVEAAGVEPASAGVRTPSGVDTIAPDTGIGEETTMFQGSSLRSGGTPSKRTSEYSADSLCSAAWNRGIRSGELSGNEQKGQKRGDGSVLAATEMG